MAERVKWGLIATGAIARAFARGLAFSQTGLLYAAGSRSQEKANVFGKEFGAAKCYGSYEALLADGDVQAVYVSTPHPGHAEWVIKAAEAGKHILVEKPIGINRCEAQAMIEAAMANKVFLMEAYMYRCHPQTARLVELLREKVIGDVRVIQATFSFQAGFNAQSRLWSNALAGGGILDVGGYTTSIARLIAGAAIGKAFADPVSVTGSGYLHPETGVDVYAVGTLKFESGIVASISSGVGVNQDNVVKIFGTEGNILVPEPYLYNRDGAMNGRIVVRRNDEKEPREIVVESPVTSFAHEADVVGRAIRAGQQEAQSMTWADTLGNVATQDAWRNAVGLVYEVEKTQNLEE